MSAFVAVKDRLRQQAEPLVQQDGFGIVAHQLYQQIADSNATECTFHLMPLPDQQVELVISDNDSDRFTDLNHVHAVFNEMLVLAYCKKARLTTTKGTVVLSDMGLETSSLRTNMGAQFWATLDCAVERYQQFVRHMEQVAVRPNLRLVVLVEEDGPRIVRDEAGVA